MYPSMCKSSPDLISKLISKSRENMTLRTLLVFALGSTPDIVRRFAASVLANFYRADGYEYIKSPVLTEKLLSNDQLARNRALTELVDNFEGADTGTGKNSNLSFSANDK
jgi:hypothetical protein